MRLVLSRKGFDAKNGGGYSPYNPRSGKYVVLPIPVTKDFKQAKQYDQVKIIKDYLDTGFNYDTLYGLIYDLKPISNTKLASLAKKKKNYVHFDPMLGPCPWINNQPEVELGAFGQSESAQGHLAAQNVGKDSLFLFFARFTPIDKLNKSSITNDTQDAYFLYGWMKVGSLARSKTDLKDVKDIAKFHHHAHMFDKWKNNTIYMPQERLFDDMDIPGCGYFSSLNESLRLSCDNLDCQDREKGCSMWAMPGCFKDNRPTYIGKRIKMCSGKDNVCCADTAIIGQEFVSDLQGDTLIWVRDLFIKNSNNIFQR